MKPPARPIKVSWNYNRAEIIADGIVHAIGAALGIAGAAVLLAITFRSAPSAEIASVIIYVIGLLSMLGLSMAYNLWPVSPRKWLLRRFDHSSIYLLIAGTYTPFIWQMKSEIMTVLLVVVWLTAAAGIAFKLFWPGRFDRLSIAFYLMLGWSGVLAYEPMAAALHSTTLWLIAIGGALYSIGVVFHVWQRLRFHTVIWHSFVVTAALVHYVAVLTSVTSAI
ncbi:MAG TPA: hemolysin III family protein [Pseudolabrys sp.]|nr:hemolysin III family protein [Pseudolabrys sp.]